MKNIYKKIIASLFFLVIFLFGSHIVSAEEISYSNDLTVGSVGADIKNNQITAGNYIVKVCVAGTNECDQSDSAFIISNSVVY